MYGAGVRSLLGRAAAAALLCAAALVTSPSYADEPRPPESDTNPRTRPHSPAQVNLMLLGAGITAVWYGAAVGTSYLWPDSDGAASLRIPVAGPYMALAKTGCSDTEPLCDTLDVIVRTVFTALSAIGQTGGVLVLGEGLFLPTAPRARRAAHSEASPAWLKPVGPKISVTPVAVGRSGFALSLSGNF
jgi:hypothetical protein